MEDLKVKILDESGKLVEHKILFTFECEELGKSYVTYEGNFSHEICVASYNPNVDLNKLEPVIDEEELKMVNDVLNKVMVEN